MDNRILMSLLLLAATVIGLSHAADPYNAADYDHTGMSTAVSKTANDEGSFFPLIHLRKNAAMAIFWVRKFDLSF